MAFKVIIIILFITFANGQLKANDPATFLHECTENPIQMTIDEQVIIGDDNQDFVKAYVENVDLHIGSVLCFKFKMAESLNYYKVKVLSVSDVCSEMKELYYNPANIDVSFKMEYFSSFLHGDRTERCNNPSIYKSEARSILSEYVEKSCIVKTVGTFANDLVEWEIHIKNSRPEHYYKVSRCLSYRKIVKFEFYSLNEAGVIKGKNISASGDHIVINFDNINIRLNNAIVTSDDSVNSFSSCVVQLHENNKYIATALIEDCNKDELSWANKFGEIRCSSANLPTLKCEHAIDYGAIQTFGTDDCYSKKTKEACFPVRFANTKQLFDHNILPKGTQHFELKFEDGVLVNYHKTSHVVLSLETLNPIIEITNNPISCTLLTSVVNLNKVEMNKEIKVSLNIHPNNAQPMIQCYDDHFLPRLEGFDLIMEISKPIFEYKCFINCGDDRMKDLIIKGSAVDPLDNEILSEVDNTNIEGEEIEEGFFNHVGNRIKDFGETVVEYAKDWGTSLKTYFFLIIGVVSLVIILYLIQLISGLVRKEKDPKTNIIELAELVVKK